MSDVLSTLTQALLDLVAMAIDLDKSYEYKALQSASYLVAVSSVHLSLYDVSSPLSSLFTSNILSGTA